MSPKERTALLLLLGIGIGGHGLRIAAVAPDRSPGGINFAGIAPTADLAAHRARSVRIGRPLGAREQLDLNTAPIDELARLPRVGIPLARAIIRTRGRLGWFVSVDELDSVPGVCPGRIRALAEHLAVSDTARVRDRRQAARGPAVSAAPPPPEPPVILTGRRRRGSGAAPETVAPEGGVRAPILLNSASENELVSLPGIGP